MLTSILISVGVALALIVGVVSVKYLGNGNGNEVQKVADEVAQEGINDLTKLAAPAPVVTPIPASKVTPVAPKPASQPTSTK